MNVKDLNTQLEKIAKLKKEKSFNNYSLKDLQSLPSFNGLCELYFKNFSFFMINILNDDSIPLKYLWRDKYEQFSLELWYDITRKDGYCFDIGAHTGIYSIIGNLNNKFNNIVSVEAYHLNFARLLSNLKINNISPINAFLASASNSEGVGKFAVRTDRFYHTQGGKLSDEGKITVPKIKVDGFKLEKKINCIKIDTEGHELEVLEGAQKYITRDKPDLIFEINESSFDNCLSILKNHEYKYYYINENDKKLIKIKRFDSNLLQNEGANCYASVSEVSSKLLID